MIYLFTFIVSIFFALLSDAARSTKLIGLRSFFIFLAIIIPSFLAGFRDVTVGIDTGAYVQSVFYDAIRSSSFIGFLNNSEPVELLFRVLAYIISRFSSNIFYFLFFIQLIILSNVIIAARLVSKSIPLWLLLVFYFFIFYYQTLNVARQFLAASFLLVSYGYVIREKVIPFLLLLAIAIGFHSTAIVYAIIYPTYKFLSHKEISKVKLFSILGLFFLGVIFLFTAFDNIIGFVINSGLLPMKFLQYQISSGRYESGIFSISDSILFGSIIGFSFYVYRRSLLAKASFFFMVLAFLTLSLNLTSLLVVWANRLYLYFALLLLLLLTAIFVKTFPFRHTIRFIFICLSVLFWFFVVIKNGGAQTYPYSSTIIGI